MEDELTLDELYVLLNSMHDRNYSEHKFLAALQGVDLDDNRKNGDFERIKMQAQAELAGKSEQEFVFDMIGIQMEEDDD